MRVCLSKVRKWNLPLNFMQRKYRQNERTWFVWHRETEHGKPPEIHTVDLSLLTSPVIFSLVWVDICLPFTHSVTLSPFFYHHLCHHHSIHSPVTVDVSGCHCVAKVGPHLEHIINKTQLVCNHTMVHRSLSFLSFSFSMSSLLYPAPPPPEAFVFNLSIPQSPGVSSSPFSWSLVLGLL